MKLKKLTKAMLGTIVLSSTLFIAGCNISAENALDMGMKGAKALSLSDAEMAEMTNQSCAQMDKQNRIAASNSNYGRRLNNIIKGLPKSVNGQTLNFKVYQTSDINAWAMANGCIRVYSGLMDKMNDDEVRAVLGHEIGHVALGHSKSEMRLAILASLGREALARHGNSTVAALSQSQIGDLSEKFINAQFSQSQETAADDYAFDMLVKDKRDPLALATGFEKLGGSSASLLSSHPATDKRINRVRTKASKLK